MIFRARRILSRPAIELMTIDHLTSEQKGRSDFFHDHWNAHGWGLGMGVTTALAEFGDPPGRYGWDGAFGTSWYFDPRDLWPLLVRVGFRPSEIKCHRHKLGLNTFAVCRVPADQQGAARA